MTLCRVSHSAFSSNPSPPPRALPIANVRSPGVVSRGLPLAQIAPYSGYVRPAFEPIEELAIYPDQEGWFFKFSVPYELTAIAVLGLTHASSALEAGINNYWGTSDTIYLLLAQPPRSIYSARIEANLKLADFAEPGIPTEIAIGTGFDITEVVVNGLPYSEGVEPGNYYTAPPDRLVIIPATELDRNSPITIKGFQKLIPRNPIARTCTFDFPQFYHCDYLEYLGHTFAEVQNPLEPAVFSLCWNPLLRFATLFLPPELQVPRRDRRYTAEVTGSRHYIELISRPWAGSGEWIYPPVSTGLITNPVLMVQMASESAVKLFTSVLLLFKNASESSVQIGIGRSLPTIAASESSVPLAITRTLQSAIASESTAQSAIARSSIAQVLSETAVALPVESKRVVSTDIGAESAAFFVVGYGFRIPVGSETAVSIALTRTVSSLVGSESGTDAALPRVVSTAIGAESSLYAAITRVSSLAIGSESAGAIGVARTLLGAIGSESAFGGVLARSIVAAIGSESGVLFDIPQGDIGEFYAIVNEAGHAFSALQAADILASIGDTESALALSIEL